MLKPKLAPGKWQQLMATGIVNLGVLTVGMAYGWTSVVTEIFQNVTDITLGVEQMTDDEISWLSSTIALSLLLILPFSGTLSERFGRRNIGIVAAVGFIITWLLRLFAKNFYGLLAAQVLTGVSDGMCSVIIPLYVTEIASDAIRGQLVAIYIFAYKGGYLFSFILAAVLPYRIATECSLIFPVMNLIGLMFLPETPVYLIRKGRLDEARRSLMFFRGNDRAIVDAEETKMKQFQVKFRKDKSELGIKDLFTNPTNFKGLMIALAMVTIQEMTGISIMVMYVVRIIDEVKMPIDPYKASISYASAQFIGAGLSTLTVDHFGRRPLLLLSSLTMAICHCIIGIFFNFQSLGHDVVAYGWLPVMAVTVFGFSYTAGFGPVALLVSNEVFNPELAGICNSIFLIGYSVIASTLVKWFPLVTDAIGFNNCFFIFFFTCLSGFLVILVTIPETKARSIESIRDELEGLDKVKITAVDSVTHSSMTELY